MIMLDSSVNHYASRSTNEWGGWWTCFFSVFLGGDGTKIAPLGDIFDQPIPCERVSIRSKFAGQHADDHVVFLSPVKAVLVTHLRATESPNPPCPNRRTIHHAERCL